MTQHLTTKKEHSLHQIFEVGVVLKGINAVVEIGLGVLLLFVNVGAILQTLVENEIVEDPQGFLARHSSLITGAISPHAQYVSALYLLSHGIIKVVLVWGLLRDKLWAYPASLAVLALFVAYQTITFTRTHSIALLLLTIFDLTLIWLIWHEYRRHAKKLGV